MRTLFTTVIVALCAFPAYAGFFGNEVRVDWRYPDFDTVFKTWELFPDESIEFDFGFHPDSSRTRIDMGDDFIFVEIDCPDQCRWSPAEFNGFWFQDINDTMPDIIGFTLERGEGLEGLEDSDIGFTENEIWFNAESVRGFENEWWFRINVEFIPAPGAFALFGLAALTSKRRRRSRHK